MNAHIEPFFDPATFTYSYVVSDPQTRQCAVIDSVLDYDPASGRTSHATAQRLVDYVCEQDLKVQWLLETHVHADHLSAAPYLRQQLGGQLAIGDRITVVQDTFGKLFNAGTGFATDGRQFDHLFHDGDTFQVGNIQARAIHTPGHTPACMTYVIGDAAFVGDTLFMPDYGTARCDFPGGDARTLYQSIQKLFALPGDTRVFMCHDYKAPGREEFLYETTIAAEREHNVHVHAGISEDQFVAMRTARDATLGMPTLILPSVQINMRGGELPEPESNGTRYLKIPLDVL
ncbi:MBL fold metallo-hydrolase [Stutzerimonas kunmingensis]|uniref:MBL fold metallo-hydrolase n=1 Tax=Stutzerimonas TaxID=2901164 RepID=UPI000C6CD4BB|nr:MULTISPECIES: MBL fold metallo-hydrolase [Stutzerimonas stutzeri subgroup]MCQ2047177.1 MBL fold metallo-hydrolase [Stutzerimonas kunmingensis]PKR28470.1 MBL fold metallo-hydrolase [Stutzerimonas stutzeri]QQC10103.1 MBL fold metallo-hydrolase [Stutzerimonas stutzeri]VEI33826.1 metallo-beta-lactamase family protein [Stutzerimonas stutzeri]